MRDDIDTGRGRFRFVQSSSLAAFLDAPMVPTLCFSDTHLVPRETSWADDSPEDLFALLEALPVHRVMMLGDLTESVGIPARERATFGSSERLAPLFRTMAARDPRIVVGNHDVRAIAILERLFGPDHVAKGGFELGRVRVRHGHEASPVRTFIESRIGPVAVPIYERLRRGRPPERLDNATVVSRIRGAAPFVIFGHTHAPVLDDGMANPGCFLRSAQSFLTIEGHEITLFRRLP